MGGEPARCARRSMPSTSSRKRLALVAGFLVALLLVLNVSTYVLYVRSKEYLDGELGERLRAIAVTLSRAVETHAADSLSAGNVEPALLALLQTTKAENLLSNIVILTPDGRTVVDLGNVSLAGEPNPFVELDYTAVSLARSGLAASTSLYRSGDIYMKSAYAPITAVDFDVIGILGVEAGAAYFDVLRALSRAILVVDAASILAVVGLGFIFYRNSVSLDRAQAAVVQGENLATMGRMVAGIAHEIRNPLSIIRASADRLRRKYNPDDEVFTYISEEVDKLNRILTGYLDFAKAQPPELKPHSIQKIIRRCLLILDSQVRERNPAVVLELPEADVMIVGDDKRLQQAVLNVLLNSLEALPANGAGRAGEIRISVARRSGFAVVTVGDNGVGIEPKHLKEVTKPFFTTKKDGSGLGMSIVNSIVEEHGGELGIRSAPGAGTEVSLSLPLAG